MKQCATWQCEAVAALDLIICWSHRNRLQIDALDLVDIHDELLDIAANGRGAGDGPRVRGGDEKLGLDLDDRLVEARDEIRRTLENCASVIIANAPTLNASQPTSLRELGQFAAAHASWLAAQEYAGDVSVALSDMVHRAENLVQSDPERSVRKVDGVRCRECTGELRAIMRRGESLLPSYLECEQGHRMLPHEWTELVDEDQDVADDQVPATVAAAALGVTTDSVYQLARRGRLTKVDTPEGPRYSLREVEKLRHEWDGVAA